MHRLLSRCKGRENSTLHIIMDTHTNCRLLSSPTAGEISPPRLRFDRFLLKTKSQKKTHQKESILCFNTQNKVTDCPFSKKTNQSPKIKAHLFVPKKYSRASSMI